MRLKPLNDFIFKKLFGEKGSEQLLLAFLNAVLQPKMKEAIEDVEIIENKVLSKELITDKTGIIDVRARLQTGEYINIEVQLLDQGNMAKRTLFYWAKLYYENLKSGENYKTLEKVITINILDFKYTPSVKFHSTYHVWEDEEKYMLTDVLETHFIELPKFREVANKNYKDNSLERWLTFFQPTVPKDTLKELIQMEPAIEEAEKKLTHLSSDEATMAWYWERERSLHEKENLVTSAEERGIEKGIEQGLKQGREEGILEGKILSAQSLLDLLDDETISLKIGLPLDEVAKLRKKTN